MRRHYLEENDASTAGASLDANWRTALRTTSHKLTAESGDDRSNQGRVLKWRPGPHKLLCRLCKCLINIP
jgi:hypothetical protein